MRARLLGQYYLLPRQAGRAKYVVGDARRARVLRARSVRHHTELGGRCGGVALEPTPCLGSVRLRACGAGLCGAALAEKSILYSILFGGVAEGAHASRQDGYAGITRRQVGVVRARVGVRVRVRATVASRCGRGPRVRVRVRGQG